MQKARPHRGAGMTLARHDPARWMRIIDEKAALTSSPTARAMLATLRKRFLCAYTQDINGFLGTFAPSFERIAYAGGSAQSSSLDDLARLASLRAAQLARRSTVSSRLTPGAIAIEGVFNMVLTNDEDKATVWPTWLKERAQNTFSQRRRGFSFSSATGCRRVRLPMAWAERFHAHQRPGRRRYCLFTASRAIA